MLFRSKDFLRYGGAGVKVCTSWHVYTQFAADMGEPIGEETLDRIDVYGDYTSENCRWADLPTQARNIRVRQNSKSGYIGVHQRGGKWMAEITANGKKFYSKCFVTLEEAADARKELERLHWGAA